MEIARREGTEETVVQRPNGHAIAEKSSCRRSAWLHPEHATLSSDASR